MHSQAQEIELVAAMFGLELAKPENRGCYLLDEECEKLLVSVLNDLKIGAEHFFNERLGSYDKINNRITPADMGIVFPDGTLRVVWREELAYYQDNYIKKDPMKTINSADDVRYVFPNALIDHQELRVDIGPRISAFANTPKVHIDGPLSWQQVEALTYWRAHLNEFKPRLGLADMPGPTSEAKVLQLKQWAARDVYYTILATRPQDKQQVHDARVVYNRTVEALEALLGKDQHCNCVDSDLWSAFSDEYLKEVGAKPPVFSTRQQVHDWFKANGFTAALD